VISFRSWVRPHRRWVRRAGFFPVSLRFLILKETPRGPEFIAIRKFARDAEVNDSGLLFEKEKTRIYSVTELNEEIKLLLEKHFDFVWVEGEISNLRAPMSGHYYMVLKDEKAQIRAIMFRPQTRYLKFRPEDGMKVIAKGRLGVYEPRGEYQIILDYLEPLGVGALALAFEQLKKRLASQGLFSEKIKKPLPFLPQKVAVITSPTGAAIRDFLKVIRRRFANIEIILVPVKVQGDEATGEMVEALELVNRKLDVDVIVLTRGGGSLEDLWAFNREELAYAIRASRIPVVSAVGHEIDVTISDLAADFRAPTPSAAAEILVAEKESLEGQIVQFRGRLVSAFKSHILRQSERLQMLGKGLRDPRRRLADSWLRLDEIHGRLIRLSQLMIREKKGHLTTEARALMLHSPMSFITSAAERVDFRRRTLSAAIMRRLKDYSNFLVLLREKLKDISPVSVLRRGYAIVRKVPEKWVLTRASQVAKGDYVSITLAEGEVECRVEKVGNR
jgi:exodeoxyribonuclease VII large subunit